MKNQTGKEFDDFINDLQNRIFDEARAAYGEIGFNRWRDPLYMGAMSDADGHGCITGSCGDTMEIFLQFNKNKVLNASYRTNGCGSSTICGSFAAEMAIGKTPDELLEITGEKILQTLSVFPKEDEHCAFLAAETLQEALNDFMKKLAKSKKMQTAAA
jgi:nitrogen fixation NifU-like protein